MVKTYEITCPDCGEVAYTNDPPGDPAKVPGGREGKSTTCLNCKSTLIFKGNEVLNLNKYLHDQSDGEWPEDGKGTFVIEIGPRTDKTEMPRKGEFIGE